MEITVVDHFSSLVETCGTSDIGRELLAMYDHTVQFSILDGDPFYFTAKNGEGRVVKGEMPSTTIVNGYEIKGSSRHLLEWFCGRDRMSDLIERGELFPVASHTTKRHIDYWLAQIVRLGNGIKTPKEVY